MDELMLLRKMVEEHDYQGALAIIDELEEMSKDDKINKVEAYLHVLLIHLIKQHAEKRSTRSWDRSVRNALRGIYKSNNRRRAGGQYLFDEELQMAIEESMGIALKDAADEAFEGIYSPEQLATMIDKETIRREAFDKILAYKP